MINEIFKLLQRENVTYRGISDANLQWLLSDLRTTLIKIRQGISGDSETLPKNFDKLLTEETTLEGMLGQPKLEAFVEAVMEYHETEMKKEELSVINPRSAS